MKYFISLLALVAFADIVSGERGRIFNGKNALETQFPYVAFVLNQFKAGSVRCSGSVLSNEWVLSAAHCVHSKDMQEVAYALGVGLGGATVKTTLTAVWALAWFVHPKYDPVELTYDFILVKIPRVQYSYRIRRIPLPPLEMAEDISAKPTELKTDNLPVGAVGWGYTTEAEILTDILQYTTFVTMSNDKCRTLLTSGIAAQHICVETGNSSICSGDSGSPLLRIDEGNQLQLIGVASFRTTKENCSPGAPVVYNRITSALGWIYKYITNDFKTILY